MTPRLEQRVKQLENDVAEKERKIKESLKAIEEFRNDAWGAHEELIIKEG